MAHSACLLFDFFFISFSSSYKRKIASVPYAVADAIQVVSNFNQLAEENPQFTLILESLGGLHCRHVHLSTLILN